jgi:hypothetical protein
MKKYIILSVNDNVDYLYFTPLVCWAWRKFGWEPIVFYNANPAAVGRLATPIEQLVFGEDPNGKFQCLLPIEGYRSDTITQISRLYGAAINGLNGMDYLMTGDIDMLPLSDYWKPEPEYRPTVWGHDLTGFGHYPICYIGMNAANWAHVMKFDLPMDYNRLIERDLDTLPQAKDPDFYKYWFSDQDLVTARLKEYGTGKIDFINRGQGSRGYARGRVDRGSGGWVLNQPELIDAHLEQQTWQNPAKVERLFELLRHVWPGEYFTWFEEYSMEFKKLAV